AARGCSSGCSRTRRTRAPRSCRRFPSAAAGSARGSRCLARTRRATQRRAARGREQPTGCGVSGSLLVLYLDQVGLDSVLSQRLAHLVDFLDLAIRPHPHPVPGPLVGEVRRLHARLEAEDREARLLVVGVGRVLERAGLDEINVLRAFLLTGAALGGGALLALALAQFLVAHRLFRARQDAVEVELRLLRRAARRRTGRGAALRQAGDRRRLGRGAVLLRLLRLRRHERDRRAVEVE